MECSRLDFPIMVAGDSAQACSLSACLIIAGETVIHYSSKKSVGNLVDEHIRYHNLICKTALSTTRYCITENLGECSDSRLVFIVTEENIEEKRILINKIDQVVSPATLICCNLESALLSDLQNNQLNQGRIIGVNWVEPVHTTCFMEIITNSRH